VSCAVAVIIHPLLLVTRLHSSSQTFIRKGKERKENEEFLYSAIYYAYIVSKRSDMDHTVLPANYTMPAFHSQAFTR